MTVVAELDRAGPADLAARFGTPLYVYDLDVVDRQVDALRAALPARFELAYAVKANPSLGVVAHLAGRGLGMDVASGGELETVLRAGASADRVVFTGPGKRDDELAAAVDAGVGVLTVESLGELRRLERLAASAGRTIRILLRAATDSGAGLERVRLVGDAGAGKFGMGPGDLREAARLAVASPFLDPLGLHAFGASNVLDPAALADHAARTVRAAAALADGSGFELRLVDVGGGLGVPYGAGEAPLDVAGLGELLGRLDRAWSGDPTMRHVRILVEPGRFLVGPAGTYVARVVDTKTFDGRDVVVLDGGIHHVLRPALVGQSHRVVPLGSRPGGGPPRPVSIVGPLCSGLDVLATAPMARLPEPGDLVAVLDVGAYGFTEAMPLFLSHPTPAEVAVRGGRAMLLRPRIEPSTWLEQQRIPAW